MAIYATVECDLCGRSISWEHVAKKHVIRWAREKGWSVGTTIKCDQCKKKKQAV